GRRPSTLRDLIAQVVTGHGGRGRLEVRDQLLPAPAASLLRGLRRGLSLSAHRALRSLPRAQVARWSKPGHDPRAVLPRLPPRAPDKEENCATTTPTYLTFAAMAAGSNDFGVLVRDQAAG